VPAWSCARAAWMSKTGAYCSWQGAPRKAPEAVRPDKDHHNATCATHHCEGICTDSSA